MDLENIIIFPVRQWAALVKRIRKYPGSTSDTPVSSVWKNHKIKHVTSAKMVASLRDAVHAIGEDKLGFKAEQVGTHYQISQKVITGPSPNHHDCVDWTLP